MKGGERDFSPCLLVADEKYGVYYLITVFKPSWSFLLDIFSMILQRAIYTIHIGLIKSGLRPINSGYSTELIKLKHILISGLFIYFDTDTIAIPFKGYNF